jgi:hypothetical protein
MITTIAIAAATGFAGLAIGSTAAGYGLRRRLATLEDVIETELVSKVEISEAFLQISTMEQQREAAISYQLQQMRAQIAQIQPVFRQGSNQVGAFQQEGAERSSSPSPAEVNAMLTQQLSAINQRLQQVTGQQMPS